MDPITGKDTSGPSVDSENQEERIAARRLRRQRRAEAKRRQEMGEEDDSLAQEEQIMSEGRKQMFDSYTRMMKLRDDGTDIVTNIRVATDAREAIHRGLEDEAKRTRKDKSEAEEKITAIRFDEINKKWNIVGKKDVPQDLFEKLEHQKQLTSTLLEEKSKLIIEFQSELKAKDDEYIQNLKKQAEDISLLVERMEEQIKELRKSYRNELESIELAFLSDRTKLRAAQRQEWEGLVRERDEKELDHMRQREERVIDYEKQLEELRTEDAEEYNLLKIKLETDVQVLQQQLQLMKATYQMNQEKLEYNFQVLRKRDEENIITKSQQKRKITRYNDMLTNIKRKMDKQTKFQLESGNQVTSEYQHIISQFQDLQRKSKLFLAADSRKFTDIWLMNEEECKALAQKLMQADRVIEEQQLGLVWNAPDRYFMQNVGPLKTDTSDELKSSAHTVAKKSVSSGKFVKSGKGKIKYEASEEEGEEEDEEREEEEEEEEEESMEEILQKFSPGFVKHMLDLLCDESGFLIEDKLHKLLAPLGKCEQMLMKLDTIFELLGVETGEDIQALSQYFLKFKSEEDEPRDLASRASDGRNRPHWNINKAGKEKPSAMAEVDKPSTPPPPPDGTIHHLTDTKEDKKKEGSARSKGGPGRGRRVDAETGEYTPDDVIHANDVLKALRAFMENASLTRVTRVNSFDVLFTVPNLHDVISDLGVYLEKADEPPTPPPEEPVILTEEELREEAKKRRRAKMRMLKNDAKRGNAIASIGLMYARDDQADAEYWAKYNNIISEDKEQVWDALTESLEKYYQLLKQRARILEETEGMRQQNTELRNLLQQYVSSKVNQELDEPPTRNMRLHAN